MNKEGLKVDELIGHVGPLLTAAQRKKGILIHALQEAQEEHNYLPEDVLESLAAALDFPAGEVYSIASFYKQFYFQPRGRHVVCVCVGTPCHVRGGGEVLERMEEAFEVSRGGTTPDLSLTLETVGCVGCCGLAPVVTVDGRVVGDVTPKTVQKILDLVEGG